MNIEIPACVHGIEVYRNCPQCEAAMKAGRHGGFERGEPIVLSQITASAVPSVPKTITATQRLAALNMADNIRDLIDCHTWQAAKNTGSKTYATVMLEAAEKMLREVAS